MITIIVFRYAIFQIYLIRFLIVALQVLMCGFFTIFGQKNFLVLFILYYFYLRGKLIQTNIIVS